MAISGTYKRMKEPTFPWVGRSKYSDLEVLFFDTWGTSGEYLNGYVLRAPKESCCVTGEHSISWIKGHFIPINRVVNFDTD